MGDSTEGPEDWATLVEQRGNQPTVGVYGSYRVRMAFPDPVGVRSLGWGPESSLAQSSQGSLAGQAEVRQAGVSLPHPHAGRGPEESRSQK